MCGIETIGTAGQVIPLAGLCLRTGQKRDPCVLMHKKLLRFNESVSSAGDAVTAVFDDPTAVCRMNTKRERTVEHESAK